MFVNIIITKATLPLAAVRPQEMLHNKFNMVSCDEFLNPF